MVFAILHTFLLFSVFLLFVKSLSIIVFFWNEKTCLVTKTIIIITFKIHCYMCTMHDRKIVSVKLCIFRLYIYIFLKEKYWFYENFPVPFFRRNFGNICLFVWGDESSFAVIWYVVFLRNFLVFNLGCNKNVNRFSYSLGW